MKFSEYIQQCRELLDEHGDAPLVFDTDEEVGMRDLPEFMTEGGAAYVISTP